MIPSKPTSAHQLAVGTQNVFQPGLDLLTVTSEAAASEKQFSTCHPTFFGARSAVLGYTGGAVPCTAVRLLHRLFVPWMDFWGKSLQIIIDGPSVRYYLLAHKQTTYRIHIYF